MAIAQIRNTKAAQGIYPAYQDLVVSVSTNQILANDTTYFYPNGWIDVLNLKMILEVYVDDVLAATLKKPRNEFSNALFNIDSVIQDYLSTDVNEYIATDANTRNAIHKTPKYSKNNTSLVKVFLKAGIEYTNSVTGNFFSSVSDTQQTGSGFINAPFFVFNGTQQNRDGELLDISTYIAAGASSLTLSDYPQGSLSTASPQRIRKSDYATMAFFNGVYKRYDTDAGITSDVNNILVTFRDAAGSSVYSFTQNNTIALGGSVGTDAMTTDGGLLFRGVGVQNMIDAGLVTLGDITNAVKYTIAYRETGNTTAYASMVYEIQDEDCKGFETIRLAWLNSLGAWDYYNFTKKSTRDTNSRRTTFTQDYGYALNSPTNAYEQGTNEGGLQAFTNTVTQSIEANTDFISEEIAAVLESLFTSPKVQLQNASGDWENVIVTEKSYTKQTSTNDKLIQYVIGVQYSHNKTVQKL
jgi:hypothetical protein